MNQDDRWALPDLASALNRAGERKRQRIRCSLSVLEEYVKGPDESFRSATGNIACLRGIASRQLDSALSVKLTALGAIFDRDLCMEHLRMIAKEAAKLHVPLELDMEGRGLVEFTIEAARACREVHDQVTIALQAYLDRTRSDMRAMDTQRISVRLVKGAYIGNVTDYFEIQARFKTLAEEALDIGSPFSAGTHDPDLVAWLEERMAEHKDLIEFGFLMGLADRTKAGLVAEGWSVSEYIPYGLSNTAYTARRERYLGDLAELGRMPLV
jgi:proline dehydrogenase